MQILTLKIINRKLLTATVPKRNSGIMTVEDKSIHKSPQEMESLFLLREDIDKQISVSIPLQQNIFEQRICDRNSSFCCDYKSHMTFTKFNQGDVS